MPVVEVLGGDVLNYLLDLVRLARPKEERFDVLHPLVLVAPDHGPVTENSLACLALKIEIYRRKIPK